MLRADMALLAEVARLNNAGGVNARRRITPKGHEETFAANHLAPFMLTAKLMPQLTAAASADHPERVIAVSSTGHERGPAIR